MINIPMEFADILDWTLSLFGFFMPIHLYVRYPQYRTKLGTALIAFAYLIACTYTDAVFLYFFLFLFMKKGWVAFKAWQAEGSPVAETNQAVSVAAPQSLGYSLGKTGLTLIKTFLYFRLACVLLAWTLVALAWVVPYLMMPH